MNNFIPVAKVELSDEEISAAVKVLKSGRLVQGEKTKRLEDMFAEKVGSKYAVAVSSGTAALHIAYLALLEPRSEVLVPSFTHISTASMVHFAGGTPIFCDIDSRTFTLDIKDAKDKLTVKTRAIAPVHLFGNACEIEEIIEFAASHNLKIVWDAAQAHGTKYRGKDVGSFNDIVCYSFYPTKNMFTGEGGMIVTNNPQLYEKCKLLRSHGQTKKYYHTMFGLNYRMSEVEAAIGIEQLKKLDDMIEKRRNNAAFLTRELSKIEGLRVPFVKEYITHSYHQYSILLDETIDRGRVIEVLRERGIGTGIHYPRPVHRQPVFNSSQKLPVCESLSQRILSLPVHPYLCKKELEAIVEGVKTALSICLKR